MSLRKILSVAKVLFSTEGLFLTLGKMMPPLRETFLAVPVVVELLFELFALLWVVLLVLVLDAVLVEVEEDDDDEEADDEDDG